MTTTYPPTTIRGTKVTFLPLITPFEAPDACSSYFIGIGTDQRTTWTGYTGTSSLGPEYFEAWAPGYQYYINTTAGCFPTEVMSALKAGNDAFETLAHATTLIAANDAVPTTQLAPFSCLRGWTSVYSTLEGESSAMTACCPSGYEASINYSGTRSAMISCLSTIGESTTKWEITYATNVSPTVNYLTATGTPEYSFQTARDSQIQIRAVPISGYNFHVASATQSSESSAQHESGLSTGAKAGIGVGVGVGVLLIIGALILFLRRSRHGPSDSEPKTERVQAPETTAIAELRGESRPPVHELHNPADKPELVGSYTPTNELAGTHQWPPQELDASGDQPVRHVSQSSK